MAVTPTLRLERRCWQAGEQVVVGIDEVGRGAWAGPVTVAAVVPPPEHLRGIRDSKLLTREDKSVFVRADGGASIQDLMEVLDRLKEGGVEKVGIMSQPDIRR